MTFTFLVIISVGMFMSAIGYLYRISHPKVYTATDYALSACTNIFGRSFSCLCGFYIFLVIT